MGKKSKESEMKKKYTINEISGVEGNCLSLNDYRIAGPKPWGGGEVVKSWTITIDDLEAAIPNLKKILRRKK